MERLAVEGGPRAFEKRTGRAEPKIGIEEFMSIAERFGFKAEALKRIREAISVDDLPEGGPTLSRYVTANPPNTKGEAFEALARRLFGVKYAAAVSSGTAALHAAFVAVGVGPGAEVICPALGFSATSMAVLMAGGVPVFCDVDESLHMDPTKIEALITGRTVAIAPTHHWGGVCDMEPILKVARKHHLKVVEDCAQGPGAQYRGKYVGTIGDMGCFSISAYKIIGVGEAGMVITNDQNLYERALQCAESGGLWRPDRFAPPRYPGELFPGTNYRLSELEAAVDVVQLGKLSEYVRCYRAVNRRILDSLKTFREIRPQTINDPDGHIGYQIRFFPQSFELAARIAAALNAEGIGANHRGKNHRPDWHLCRDMFPVVLKTSHVPGGSPFEDPRYVARGGRVEYREENWPVAVDLYAREVAIGLDQWYSEDDCNRIAAGINKVLSAYCTPDAGAKPWRRNSRSVG